MDRVALVHCDRGRREVGLGLCLPPATASSVRRIPRFRVGRLSQNTEYRVGLVVWQLGWVDLDLECSTILLGQ